jgi:hypothetical protein
VLDDDPLLDPYEPPTEPIAAAPVIAPAPPPPPPPPPPAAAPFGPFAATRYRFTTGLRTGEVAAIRDQDGKVLLSYRSFASVVGIVATLVSAIVLLAGLASVLFLLAEGSPLRALAALVLTLTFATFIAMLVPRVNVTLYDEHHPALTVWQRTLFPRTTYVVATPNGTTLAEVRRTFLSRLGRNRWTILQDGRPIGEAVEDSFAGAMVRKLLGKFDRRFETNLRITHGGLEAGRIVRREGELLELTSDALDRRVAVALATLVFGREP